MKTSLDRVERRLQPQQPNQLQSPALLGVTAQIPYGHQVPGIIEVSREIVLDRVLPHTPRPGSYLAYG